MLLNSLQKEFKIKLIFAIVLLIIDFAVNEPCKIGWDANKFIYMLSGVFLFDSFLIIIQITRLKAQLEIFICIEYLRLITYFAKAGLILYGFISIMSMDVSSDCMILDYMGKIGLFFTAPMYAFYLCCITGILITTCCK